MCVCVGGSHACVCLVHIGCGRADLPSPGRRGGAATADASSLSVTGRIHHTRASDRLIQRACLIHTAHTTHIHKGRGVGMGWTTHRTGPRCAAHSPTNASAPLTTAAGMSRRALMARAGLWSQALSRWMNTLIPAWQQRRVVHGDERVVRGSRDGCRISARTNARMRLQHLGRHGQALHTRRHVDTPSRRLAGTAPTLRHLRTSPRPTAAHGGSAHGQHTVSTRSAHGQHTVSTRPAHGSHSVSTPSAYNQPAVSSCLVPQQHVWPTCKRTRTNRNGNCPCDDGVLPAVTAGCVAAQGQREDAMAAHTLRRLPR